MESKIQSTIKESQIWNEVLWFKQRDYNEKIRNMEHTGNKEYWTKQYLLGLVSEVDEVLQNINWKIHRRGHPTDRYNLGRELADMTKYIWSLWELHDFSYIDMLQFVHEKTQELDIQWEQDFVPKISPECDIIVTDIDGTIGDWRTAFIQWYETQTKQKVPNKDTGVHMPLELELGIPYPVYIRYKEEFEASGGYRSIRPYADAIRFLRKSAADGVCIIAYTARPAGQYGRIWTDSWHWISEYQIPISELRIGSEERIARAHELQQLGKRRVVMLEDDPTLALRAAGSKIKVFLRHQPYNAGVQHRNIDRVTSFDEIETLF